MKNKNEILKIAIVGGGPSALYMLKRLVDTGDQNLWLDIYEKGDSAGCGMPYSKKGAADEHITNVSGNEIPEMAIPISEWIQKVPKDTLDKYNIDPARFNEYKVLPRLLFGQYLSAQFNMLLQQARDNGQQVNVHYNTVVADITDQPDEENVHIILSDKTEVPYDRVIICTGHSWPKKQEGKVKGWFDSPYPPEKISVHANHAVAIRGASLTAIDALRTLARHNGEFHKNADGKLIFEANADSPNFRIVLHSRNGLLPAVRFHLEDTHLGKDTILDKEVVQQQREANDGFLPLDFVFEQNFKAGLKLHDPVFYEKIKHLTMEEFVNAVMDAREQMDPFELLKAEYAEAERSIKKEKSVYWKEMLAILSFAMNYPAKYFSAEDKLRLQKVLMPLISVVIAFVPQSSAETLMALHDAGRLDMVVVDDNSEVLPQQDWGALYKFTDESGNVKEVYYKTFVDAVGQQPFAFQDIPFKSLLESGTLSKAKLRFRQRAVAQNLSDKDDDRVTFDNNGDAYLTVPGVAINDNFQPLDRYGAFNERIYIMAVPFIAGFNPDYSGLDFCEAASGVIINSLLGTTLVETPVHHT